MEAHNRQTGGNDRHMGPEATESVRDLRRMPDTELDRQIETGWDIWCELLDDLLSTAGLLPSRELAGRVVGFFEDTYWRAEDARVEALRRRVAAQGLRRCRLRETSRGIR
jgi:hypothetical protein